jgi:hypothetical protein
MKIIGEIELLNQSGFEVACRVMAKAKVIVQVSDQIKYPVLYKVAGEIRSNVHRQIQDELHENI